jgi:hypothetical protein
MIKLLAKQYQMKGFLTESVDALDSRIQEPLLSNHNGLQYWEGERPQMEIMILKKEIGIIERTGSITLDLKAQSLYQCCEESVNFPIIDHLACFHQVNFYLRCAELIIRNTLPIHDLAGYIGKWRN